MCYQHNKDTELPVQCISCCSPGRPESSDTVTLVLSTGYMELLPLPRDRWALRFQFSMLSPKN